MVKQSSGRLDATFGALADPTRRAILQRLAQGAAPVTELARPFAVSLPAISKHLGVLERAGLIVRERDGRIRRCRLVAEPLHDVADWVERYRRFWEGQLDQLARYLQQADTKGRPGWSPRHTPSRSASVGSSTRRSSGSSKRGPTRRS